MKNVPVLGQSVLTVNGMLPGRLPIYKVPWERPSWNNMVHIQNVRHPLAWHMAAVDFAE